VIGFTFNDENCSKYNIVAKSVDRSLLPKLRKNEFTIPGRHGAVDYGSNTYEKRIIVVECNYRSTSYANLRSDARRISKWLSGKGSLYFDDETDKVYEARLYSEVPLESRLKFGRFTLKFECQPFAESLNYQQVNTDITTNNKETTVSVSGTSETPCIITIKNTGVANIGNITIRRKAAV
jgi:predicted phage tail component-like protein